MQGKALHKSKECTDVDSFFKGVFLLALWPGIGQSTAWALHLPGKVITRGLKAPTTEPFKLRDCLLQLSPHSLS